jgi:hypothetical protein
MIEIIMCLLNELVLVLEENDGISRRIFQWEDKSRLKVREGGMIGILVTSTFLNFIITINC